MEETNSVTVDDSPRIEIDESQIRKAEQKRSKEIVALGAKYDCIDEAQKAIEDGKDGQTDSSDYKGHEIRLACTILENLNLVSRLYIVGTLTSYQRGNRFRMDLNWVF